MDMGKQIALAVAVGILVALFVAWLLVLVLA